MSSSIVGLVIYTGKETRSQMNISNDRYKIGSLDYEINTYNKFLSCLSIPIPFIFYHYQVFFKLQTSN